MCIRDSYESSQYNAQHTAITKKGSKYLRKTLYQIILPVIKYNPVFKKYYLLKISQGKGPVSYTHLLSLLQSSSCSFLLPE